MVWLIGTVFALCNVLPLTTLGGFEFFEKIAIYWFLERFGHLENFGASTDIKTRKKSKDMLKHLFFVAVSKHMFSSKADLSFFRFRPLVHPIGAVRTENTWSF